MAFGLFGLFGLEGAEEDEDEDSVWTAYEFDGPPPLPCLETRLVFDANGKPEYVPVLAANGTPSELRDVLEIRRPAKHRSTHEIAPSERGKQPAITTRRTSGVVELSSHLGDCCSRSSALVTVDIDVGEDHRRGTLAMSQEETWKRPRTDVVVEPCSRPAVVGRHALPSVIRSCPPMRELGTVEGGRACASMTRESAIMVEPCSHDDRRREARVVELRSHIGGLPQSQRTAGCKKQGLAGIKQNQKITVAPSTAQRPVELSSCLMGDNGKAPRAEEGGRRDRRSGFLVELGSQKNDLSGNFLAATETVNGVAPACAVVERSSHMAGAAVSSSPRVPTGRTVGHLRTRSSEQGPRDRAAAPLV